MSVRGRRLLGFLGCAVGSFLLAASVLSDYPGEADPSGAAAVDRTFGLIILAVGAVLVWSGFADEAALPGYRAKRTALVGGIGVVLGALIGALLEHIHWL